MRVARNEVVHDDDKVRNVSLEYNSNQEPRTPAEKLEKEGSRCRGLFRDDHTGNW